MQPMIIKINYKLFNTKFYLNLKWQRTIQRVQQCFDLNIVNIFEIKMM